MGRPVYLYRAAAIDKGYLEIDDLGIIIPEAVG